MKCEICKLEINLRDTQCGHIESSDKRVYCEKCYADKRFNEIKKLGDDKLLPWLEQVKSVIQDFDEPSFDEMEKGTNRKQKKQMIQAMMRKIPSEWESLFKDKKYVKKVRDNWKKFNWHVD